jgi:hypothetical protein
MGSEISQASAPAHKAQDVRRLHDGIYLVQVMNRALNDERELEAFHANMAKTRNREFDHAAAVIQSFRGGDVSFHKARVQAQPRLLLGPQAPLAAAAAAAAAEPGSPSRHSSQCSARSGSRTPPVGSVALTVREAQAEDGQHQTLAVSVGEVVLCPIADYEKGDTEWLWVERQSRPAEKGWVQRSRVCAE